MSFSSIGFKDDQRRPWADRDQGDRRKGAGYKGSSARPSVSYQTDGRGRGRGGGRGGRGEGGGRWWGNQDGGGRGKLTSLSIPLVLLHNLEVKGNLSVSLHLSSQIGQRSDQPRQPYQGRGQGGGGGGDYPPRRIGWGSNTVFNV